MRTRSSSWIFIRRLTREESINRTENEQDEERAKMMKEKCEDRITEHGEKQKKCTEEQNGFEEELAKNLTTMPRLLRTWTKR